MPEEQDLSPTRKVVQTLPLDVGLEIVRHLGAPPEYKNALADLRPDMTTLRRRSIRNMALVCREFYLAIFPCLFENVYVYAMTGGKPSPAHCGRFCESIASGDERALFLATRVKTFVLGGYRLAADLHSESLLSRRLKSAYYACAKALPHMSNLRELYLFQTSITTHLAHGIGSLPPLKRINFSGCDVPEAVDASALEKFAAVHTQTVQEGDSWYLQHDEFALDVFRSLPLSHTEHFAGHETYCHVLSGIAHMSPLLHLTTVHISNLKIRKHPHALADALAVMPNLKALRIHTFTYESDDVWSVEFPTTYPRLPVLRDVYLSLSALQAIVPGTLVSSIGIAEEMAHSGTDTQRPRDAAFWATAVAAFKLSRRLINKLDIPMSFYLAVPFSVNFPALKHLTVRPLHDYFMREPDWVVHQLASAWPHHPELLELEFTYNPPFSPLRDEEEVQEDGSSVIVTTCDVSYHALTALEQSIPTLRKLTFSAETEGGRVYKKFELDVGKQEEADALDFN